MLKGTHVANMSNFVIYPGTCMLCMTHDLRNPHNLILVKTS